MAWQESNMPGLVWSPYEWHHDLPRGAYDALRPPSLPFKYSVRWMCWCFQFGFIVSCTPWYANGSFNWINCVACPGRRPTISPFSCFFSRSSLFVFPYLSALWIRPATFSSSLRQWGQPSPSKGIAFLLVRGDLLFWCKDRGHYHWGHYQRLRC